MKTSIFYSWQSDTDCEVNKKFVEKAIEKAIKKLKNKPDYRFKEFVTDRDTKDVPGSPNIPNTLKDKIEKCNVFIGDLTIVNNSTNSFFKFLNENVLHVNFSMNSNVMKELGYAESIIGESNIVCVMNTAFGDPSKNAELMPFDIRGNRWPIMYSLTKKTEKDYNNKLEALSKEIETALDKIIKYNFQNPILKYFPFLDFETWQSTLNPSIQFFKNEKLKSIIKTICDTVIKKNGIIRLNGLSGLGKTRLVYECFATFTDHKIFKKILYYNCSNEDPKLWEIVTRLSRSREQKILVLDNCDWLTHEKAKELVLGVDSTLSLITINPTIIESELEKSSGTLQLELRQEDCFSIIDDILNQFFPDESEKVDRNRIKEFANGHTFIAVILAKEVIRCRESGEQWRPIVNKKDLLYRILGVNSSESETLEVLQSCATFTRFGFFTELEYQCEAIAQNKNLLILAKIPSEGRVGIVKQVCTSYLKKEIFERQGRYLQIRIKPIAISLALQWWETTTADNILNVFNDISDDELRKNFCDQLRYLDFLPDAKEAVEKLCQGPFCNAEVLNTYEGSRLFRSLVEVNPEAATKALSVAFSNQEYDDLRKILDGRRNIVWALEKLCFRKETFFDATKIMMDLAAAENEDISNNSTGQFVHLFQVHLAGTQATLIERKEFLQKVELIQKPEYHLLYISALIRSLESRNLMRFGGAELQGTHKLEDYIPSNREILEYWEFSINKLSKIALSDSPYHETAIKGLKNHARSLINMGAFDLIVPELQKVSERDDREKLEIFRLLKTILHFDGKYLHIDQKKIIDDLVQLLCPDSFEQRFDVVIRNPIWDEDDYNLATERIEKEAELLADEFTKLDFDTIDFCQFYNAFPSVGMAFGIAVGQRLINTPGEKLFFTKSLSAIKSLSKQQQFPVILAGFFKGISLLGGNINNYLQIFRENHDLQLLAFNITALSDPTLKNIIALFEIVDIDPQYIYGFRRFYIYQLTPKETLKFIEKLLHYGRAASWIALDILFMYVYNNKPNWEACKYKFRDILMTPGLILKDENHNNIDLYHWSDIMWKLLTEDKDEELANFAIQEILLLSNENYSVISYDAYLAKVVDILMISYFKVIWPVLGQALLNNSTKISGYNLKTLLGSRIAPYEDSIGFLFKGDLDLIFKWCEENRQLAPSIIASMVPIYHNTEGKIEWHPFTRRLIDEFGNDKSFLTSLTSNMGSYSWSGSIIPLLENKISILKQLIPHPKLSVENWAKSQMIYLQEYITKEKIQEVEGYL